MRLEDEYEVRESAGYTSRWKEPARWIVVPVGVVLAVIGAVGVIEGGLSETINRPVVDVFGFSMSPIVSLVLLAVGVLATVAALAGGARETAGALAGVLFIGGVVLLALASDVRDRIGVGREVGWLAIVLGVIALVGALFPSRSTVQRTEERSRIRGGA